MLAAAGLGGGLVLVVEDFVALETGAPYGPGLVEAGVDPARLVIVRTHDARAFERGGFLVSPRLGLAFVPTEPDWVTALAAHCLDTWRQLGQGAAG